MAHPAQLDFFAHVIEHFPEAMAGRVVDVGSTDVNGGPQDLLSTRHYLGVDLAPGANVDLVGDGARLPLRDAAFDAAISSECFEHTPAWPEIVSEMVRVIRPSGLIVFSAASTGRAEHGTRRSDGGEASPASVGRREWYRNLSQRQVVRALQAMHLPVSMVFVDRRVCDLYAVAVKEPTSPADRLRLNGIAAALANRPGPNRHRHRGLSRVVLGLAGDRVFRWADHHRRGS